MFKSKKIQILQTLKLLLPSIIPSWRFFDTVAPSPRIEFTILENMQDKASKWQEFRPRPARLAFGAMLGRMFWNPRWNESLFLVSCAERLMANPTEHSSTEIFNRIKTNLIQRSIPAKYMQFRLVFIIRQGKELQKHITYTSKVQSIGGDNL